MGDPSRTTALRSVLVAAAASAAVIGLALPASAAPPALDPGFGTGGVVTDPTKGAFLDVVPMADGGYAAVAGITHNDWLPVDPAPGVGFVTRVDAHGVPVPTFGTNGRAAVARDGYRLTFYELAHGPAGTLVLIGSYSRLGACGLVAARMSAATGALDASFGTGGLAFVYSGADLSCSSTGSVRPDGRVLMATSYQRMVAAPPHYLTTLFVTELSASGVVRRAFGRDGRSVIAARSAVQVGRMHLSADGSVLLGIGVLGPAAGVGVLRLRPDGLPDTTFSGDGQASRRPFGNYLSQGVVDVVPQSGRRVVVAGSLDPLGQSYTFNNATAVVRFTASGAADPTFAHGAGFVRLSRTYVTRVRRASDGSLVVAGSDQNGTYEEFGDPRRVGRVAHLSANGVPDTTWSASGVRSILVPGTWQGIHDGLALQASGRIALAGEWSTSHAWSDPPVPTANLLVLQGTRPGRVRGWLESRLSGASGGWRTCGTTAATACPLGTTWYLTGGGWPFEARDAARVIVQVQRRGADGVWRSYPMLTSWVTDDGAFRGAGKVVSKGLYRFRAAVPASSSTVTTYSAWSYGRK